MLSGPWGWRRRAAGPVGIRLISLVTRCQHTHGERFQGMGIQYYCPFGRACVLSSFICHDYELHIFYVRHAETPPGEESRLTRAMKAYHLEKARDPTDLPPWLFEEHERRPVDRPSASTWHREASEPSVYESRDDAAPPRGRGLRDIYDAAAATTSAPPRQERREMFRGRQDDGHSSKANDRRKALRDAKRNSVQQRNASVSGGGLESTNDEWSSAREEYSRGYGADGGAGSAAHSRRAPSLPGSVRPGVGSGLPPRPGSRK